MGSINLDNTGSGSGITLSSDGTSLLLDGTAVGGGGADLYTANPVNATDPTVAGNNSIAIGSSAVGGASGQDNALAIGTSSEATRSEATAVGYNVTASGLYSMAFGGGATASGTQSISIGRNVTASGDTSVALGSQATSTQARSTAIGTFAQATGAYSVALGGAASDGMQPSATGTDSIAIGGTNTASTRRAKSSNTGSVALGAALASGADSFAATLTTNSTSYGAQGTNSIAIGQLAKATAANSIAIGDTATSTTANLIALGGTTDTVQISGTYTLPTADGSANQVLTTNGSGVVTFADASGGISNVVEDTSPQLGGNLDVQAREINTSTTNGNIVFNPNGTGVVEVKGAGGNDGTLQLNCSANSHGVKIKSPPHSAGASYTLTLPNDDGDASEFLQTNGSGVLTWAAAGADLYAANPSSATDPVASGTNAVAIGSVAVASGTSSTAVGFGSLASNTNAFAGPVSNSSGVGSVALGIGTNSTSYGATGNYALAMGYQSKATGGNAVAVGGDALATGSDSIAIGDGATAVNSNDLALGISRASGYNATSIQIENNTSSYGASDYLAVAIGKRAKASQGSAVAIGNFVSAEGSYSLAMGRSTQALQIYSNAFGYGSSSNIQGKLAYASGWHATYGDAQGGQFILRKSTTDATATVLSTNNGTAGATNQIVAASDTCISFDGTITAMQNGAQAYGSWKIEGLLVNDGGTTTLANSAITVIQNSSNWGLALSADNTNNALAITCTGEANHNIRWVANIRTSEVTYA